MSLKILFPSTAMLLVLAIQTSAQTAGPIKVSGILNTSGSYSQTNGLLLDFNICEMVLIDSYQVQGMLLTQGFLQPVFKKQPEVPEAPKGPNNVITPNGDGRNDVFVLPDADDFPQHHLRIFDRAGRQLYESFSYKNDWNGYFKGKLLAEDTYYYIWLPGPNYSPIRGFITIIHDK